MTGVPADAATVKLHVMGHTYCTVDGRPVRLSVKSLALLAYLALERRPHHRDRVADLLWESSGALRNLRVELSRLRQRGLNLFAAGEPMLDLKVATDLDEWLAAPDDATESELSAWLSASGGLPLSGLDDVGTVAFRSWLDTRRAVIAQVVEERLHRAHTRQLARGGGGAALIEGHLHRQGLSVPATPASPPTRLTFERPDLRAKLRDILRRAAAAPQLVAVEDRSWPDLREIAQQVAADAGWQLLDVRAPADPDLLAPVLGRQLWHLTAPDTAPAGEPGDLLVQAWTRVAASGQKVLVAIHVGASLAAPVVRSLQVALSLPGRLAVLLYGTHGGGALHQHLATFDAARVHRLSVPPLGVAEILALLARADPALSAEQRLELAIVIAQQSEGWGYFAQSLVRRVLGARVGDTLASVSLLDEVRDVLLGEVAGLEPRLRAALTRLATIHSAFDVALATVLLGPDAPDVLEEAERRGLLSTAAPSERVAMPSLRYQSSDQDDQLSLAGEPLRATLSGMLTSMERRSLRAQMARHHLEDREDAALALYYAQRAARPDLAQAAQARPVPARAAVAAQRGPVALHSGHHAHLEVASGSRREQRTGNGYRVALEGGYLQVLRYGVHARAPLLRLHWPRVPAGEWQLVARVDVFHEAAELGAAEPGFALGIQLPGAPLLRYRPDEVWEDAGAEGGRVPLGRWFRLAGRCASGPVEVQVRALDVALTIASWHVGGEVLVPVTDGRT
ncbi:hypothetical protein HNQ07_001307 [Deinococcus metalli]|uniref:SARP family transcriptional regulator n=1 Tax=Deinococcus metalli TaxID=1141878 RepID=A0A7W8KCU5_9DEIO|nr:hypothetical protein [Deinococcus metalli]MBB5375850.1 hypothetical protein [Deinococcus metalli]GHF36568.1 hypothetical protein GCM10017781_11530 [Deinococcus metalli]